MNETYQEIALHFGTRFNQSKSSLEQIADFADNIREFKPNGLPCLTDSFRSELDSIGYYSDSGFEFPQDHETVYRELFLKPYLEKIYDVIVNVEGIGIEEAINLFYLKNKVDVIVDSRWDPVYSWEVWGSLYNCHEWAKVLDLELAYALGQINIENAKKILMWQ